MRLRYAPAINTPPPTSYLGSNTLTLELNAGVPSTPSKSSEMPDDTLSEWLNEMVHKSDPCDRGCRIARLYAGEVRLFKAEVGQGRQIAMWAR